MVRLYTLADKTIADAKAKNQLQQSDTIILSGGYVMLKRIIYLFILYFFICINSVTAAEPEKHLVILYNSDTKSYLEGCG